MDQLPVAEVYECMSINEFMRHASKFAYDWEEASLMWDVYLEDPGYWEDRGFRRIQQEMLDRKYPQAPIKV